MKKLLTLLTLCVLPFFAIAQEMAQASSSTETAVQTAQANDMQLSHLIGIIIAFIIIGYIGKKLYILKIFQILARLPWGG